MATTISYTEILLGFICLAFLCHWIWNRTSRSITNWPVIGMLPGGLWNLSRLHDYATEILKQSGGTLVVKGPWFCNLNFVGTSDPMNVHHILSKSSPNYSRGPEFSVIFEPFGDGIIAAESDSWKFQRKLTHSYLNGAKFRLFLEKTIQEKVANGLIPILDHVCAQKMEVNIEDVFERFGFDVTCLLILGCDPKCLSVEFPKVPYEKAFKDVEDGMLYRNVVPLKYWKLMKRLQMGEEKKLSAALKIFDDFIHRCILSKRQKMEEDGFDFVTAYLMEEEAIKAGEGGAIVKSNPKFLRDLTSNIVAAGRSAPSAALTWFFWLLAAHKSVESKILEEIKQNLGNTFSAEDVNKLVYLHAALCETLRLYPSVPYNHKCAEEADTLPSGHHVKANTKIIISYYAMGRMEEIWGKDCCEFKPERWIAEDGGIVHVPSYKFAAFSTGPRSCVGKDTGLMQMKIVAATIIMNYQLRVVDKDHLVVPSISMALHTKHGVKVRVTKTSL